MIRVRDYQDPSFIEIVFLLLCSPCIIFLGVGLWLSVLVKRLSEDIFKLAAGLQFFTNMEGVVKGE
jgi:hypothetical protein